MSKSVITASAKNIRPLSGRRRLAALAATAVLAGGVQFLATDTAWACDSGADTTAPKPVTPASAHHGELSTGFHMTPDGQTLTAGGAKVEIGMGVGNFTGARYENVTPSIAVFNPKGATNLQDFTIEAKTPAGWKKLGLRHGCDPTVFADTSSLVAKTLDDGRAANFLFRISVAANAAADLNELQIFANGEAAGYPMGDGEIHTFKITQPAHPAAPKAGTTAKPAAPKATPTTAAKPAPAKPAADQTPATTPATPKATPSAPATTAPAGTPELAQTGANTPNGFLAASAAAFVALGAGVLIAVRRLRPQR
ncbi:hypothetical protein OH807_20900 [Kitasatospora sp. NBC_01560]|uniref:hypothetical protein n=1 Tax=Kitasatospora sp. NBC_01560 TaxID=2975965 RepID=UPI003865B976